MTRVAAILLLVGGVLLISWAIAPASAIPGAPRTAPSVTPAPRDQDVAADVAKLRERLAVAREYASPRRDPFRYGAATREAAPPVEAAAPEPASDSVPTLPRLVAILSNRDGDVAIFRAVFTRGSDVVIVRAGDSVDALRVRSVTSDAVELVDPVSLRAFRLTLK